MDVKKAYQIWADQYDTNHNRTRDLESFAHSESLELIEFNSCLEIGCGSIASIRTGTPGVYAAG